MGIEPIRTGVAHPSVTLNRLQEVPPPGIEPGPLGLQPSAQTNCARVGSVLRAALGRHAASLLGCLPAPSSSSLFGCQRSRSACAGRTSGGDASAAFAGAPSRPRPPVIHSGSRVAEFSCLSTSDSSGVKAARNVEGPPGFPGWPFSAADLVDQLPGGPPRVPISNP